VTVLHQQWRYLPYVSSEKKEFKLGDSVIFDLMPPAGQLYELRSIKTAAFSAWDGPLVPLSHGLWLHSVLKICSYDKPIIEAPLFRLADRQLYPTEFRSVLWEASLSIHSQEPCSCRVETIESAEDKARYTLMLIIDMQKAKLV
jgi:hypothetical protein